MNMKFKKGTKRAEMANAIDQFVLGTVGVVSFNIILVVPSCLKVNTFRGHSSIKFIVVATRSLHGLFN
jgi:hypothetical protein